MYAGKQAKSPVRISRGSWRFFQDMVAFRRQHTHTKSAKRWPPPPKEEISVVNGNAAASAGNGKWAVKRETGVCPVRKTVTR